MYSQSVLITSSLIKAFTTFYVIYIPATSYANHHHSTMMSPTLYHVPRTISSPLVQVLLELDAVDKFVHVEEMAFPELKSPEYLAVNPMGTSPAFRDTELDITMFESGAILDYLLERYDTEHQFHPAPCSAGCTRQEVKSRAKYLQLKQYILATVYPFIASMYIHSLKNEGEIDKEYMAAAKHKCHTVLGPVLTRWLGDGPYFLGERLSAVDFLVAKPLGNAHSMGLLGDFPALGALLERISSRPTYKMAYEMLPTVVCPDRPDSSSNKPSQHPNDRSMVLVPKREVKSEA